MLGKKDLVARFMSLAMKSRTIQKKRIPKQKIDYCARDVFGLSLNSKLNLHFEY
jgi:hypothetical protein